MKFSLILILGEFRLIFFVKNIEEVLNGFMVILNWLY